MNWLWIFFLLYIWFSISIQADDPFNLLFWSLFYRGLIINYSSSLSSRLLFIVLLLITWIALIRRHELDQDKNIIDSVPIEHWDYLSSSLLLMVWLFNFLSTIHSSFCCYYLYFISINVNNINEKTFGIISHWRQQHTIPRTLNYYYQPSSHSLCIFIIALILNKWWKVYLFAIFIHC